MPRRSTNTRPLPVNREFVEGFWARVNRDPGCWVWQQGNLTESGYASCQITHRRRVHAARIAWEFMHGAIPDGQYLHLTCNNRSCVNPAHHVFSSTRAMSAANKKLDEESQFFTKSLTEVSRETRAEHGLPALDDTLPAAGAVTAPPAAPTQHQQLPHISHHIVRATLGTQRQIELLSDTVTELAGRLDEILVLLRAQQASAQAPAPAPTPPPPPPMLHVEQSPPAPPPETISPLITLASTILGQEPLSEPGELEEIFRLARASTDTSAGAMIIFRTWLHSLRLQIADGCAEPSAAALYQIALADLGPGAIIPARPPALRSLGVAPPPRRDALPPGR